jgi:arsenate reductase
VGRFCSVTPAGAGTGGGHGVLRAAALRGGPAGLALLAARRPAGPCDAVEVRSAGSEPVDQINPVAVEAMREVGIDITAEQPKKLEYATAQQSDVIITMGCGDACPVFPGKRYEDWKLDDPAGQDIEAVRPIRDEIRERVAQLVSEIVPGNSRAYAGR